MLCQKSKSHSWSLGWLPHGDKTLGQSSVTQLLPGCALHAEGQARVGCRAFWENLKRAFTQKRATSWSHPYRKESNRRYKDWHKEFRSHLRSSFPEVGVIRFFTELSEIIRHLSLWSAVKMECVLRSEVCCPLKLGLGRLLIISWNVLTFPYGSDCKKWNLPARGAWLLFLLPCS